MPLENLSDQEEDYGIRAANMRRLHHILSDPNADHAAIEAYMCSTSYHGDPNRTIMDQMECGSIDEETWVEISSHRGRPPPPSPSPDHPQWGGMEVLQDNRRSNDSVKFNLHLPLVVFDIAVLPERYARIHREYDVDEKYASRVRRGEELLDSKYATYDYWEEWNLYIPICYWSANAKGFASMEYSTFPNPCKAYQELIELMLYAAEAVDIDNRRNGVGVEECRLAYELVLADGSPLEPERERKYAGRRLRLLAPKQGLTFGHAIKQLIIINQTRFAQQHKAGILIPLHGSSSSSSSSSRASGGCTRGMFTALTKARWEELCCTVLGLNHFDKTSNINGKRDMTHPEGYFNAVNVFSMPMSVTLSLAAAGYHGNPKPCAASADMMNYIILKNPKHGGSSTNRLARIFPHHGKLAWGILSSSDFTANTFRATYLPESPRSAPHTPSEQQKAWVAQARCVPGVMPPEALLSPGERIGLSMKFNSTFTPEHLAIIHDETINRQPVKDTGFGMDEMKQLCDQIFTDHKHKCMGRTADDYRQSMRTAQLDCMSEFMRRMATPDAVLPPSGKVVVSWYHDYLEKNFNLSKPRANDDINLSSFENCLAQSLQTFEGLGKINITHVDILLYFTSAIYCWAEKDLNIHVLITGPSAWGKSMAMLFTRDRLLIQGTHRRETYSTDKNLTAGGSDRNDPCWNLTHDQMIVISDDVPPSQLGVREGAGAASVNGGASDRESINKFTLEGSMDAPIWKVNENGDRVFTDTHMLCRGPRWYGANLAKAQIPTAMLSRFADRDVCKRTRKSEDRDLVQLIMANLSSLERDDWAECQERFRLTHCRAWFVFKFILLGIFPNGVDMSAAKVLIVNTFQRAKAMGLKTDEARDLKRLLMAVEALVVWDAVDTVFDSPHSRVAGLAWKTEHWIEVEKHLVAKKRHVALAFGLCASQWDDPIQARVQHEIVKYVNLKKPKVNPTLSLQGVQASVTTVPAGFGIPSVAEVAPGTGKASNYVTCPLTFSTTDGSRGVEFTQKDLIHRFTGILLQNMGEDKPKEQVVEMVVEALTELYVEIPNRESPTHELKTIAALQISNGAVNVAYTMMVSEDVQQESSRLKKALFEVLHHKYARKDDILYGAALSPDNPFLLDYISIEEGGDGKTHMVIPPIDAIDPNVAKAIQSYVKHSRINSKEYTPTMERQDRVSPVDTFAPLKCDIDDYATDCINIDLDISPWEEHSYPRNDTFLEKDYGWSQCETYEEGVTLPYPIRHKRANFEAYIGRRQKRKKEIEGGKFGRTCYSSDDILQARKKRKDMERAIVLTSVDDEKDRQARVDSAREKRLREFQDTEEKNPFDAVLRARHDYKNKDGRGRPRVEPPKNRYYNQPLDVTPQALFLSDFCRGEEQEQEQHVYTEAELRRIRSLSLTTEQMEE